MNLDSESAVPCRLASSRGTWLEVAILEQVLKLRVAETVIDTWSISTAQLGVGELANSYQTPRGWHFISACLGADLLVGSVLVGRQPTGEIYDAALAAQFPARDWILTRIIRLRGMEPHYNLGQTVSGDHCDSEHRFIYIHGTPSTEPMGIPRSHGCIRMHDADLLTLFDHVFVGMPVWIHADESASEHHFALAP